MASNPATDCLFYVVIAESAIAKSAAAESLDLSLTVFFSKGSGALETSFDLKNPTSVIDVMDLIYLAGGKDLIFREYCHVFCLTNSFDPESKTL